MYPLSIRLRRPVAHARSTRSSSDAVVVGVELDRGVVGYGETLPRPYVTGETVESVCRDIEREFATRLLEFRPASFVEALEAIDALPMRDDAGRLMSAARAAVEVALLDAYSRWFDRPLEEMVGWLGLPGFGSPGSLRHARCSGVIASTSARVAGYVRLYRWFGIRDFKLKVGVDGDAEAVAATVAYLRRRLAAGRATLRLDANGAWTLGEAAAALDAWRDHPIAAIEQPLDRAADADLPRLRAGFSVPFIHDESLVTVEDAERLEGLGVADGFNIRVSKCGGLMPSLRLAARARRIGAIIQIGCMVGETSILTAAGQRLVEWTPGVRFVEGAFGSFLLSADVVKRPLRFGYGGRVRGLNPVGLGVEVDPDRLREVCDAGPIRLVL